MRIRSSCLVFTIAMTTLPIILLSRAILFCKPCFVMRSIFTLNVQNCKHCKVQVCFTLVFQLIGHRCRAELNFILKSGSEFLDIPVTFLILSNLMAAKKSMKSEHSSLTCDSCKGCYIVLK